MMIKENKYCGDDGSISDVNPANTTTPYLCDDIISDILSRLPVKSLMRFKLVCKHWQNWIQNDLFFMNLHLTNSEKLHDPGVMDLIFKTSTKPISPGSLGSDLCLANVCRTNEHHHVKPVVAAVHRYKSLYTTPEFWGIFMRPLNGLICFVRNNEGYIRVANITTGEETPWIKATLKDHCWVNFFLYKSDWWTGFGYDPVTKQHKVICVYEKRWKDTGEIEEVCEVMTLGRGGGNNNKNNYTWRRIDEYPQYRIRYFDECICVKGSIYWISRGHVRSHGKTNNPITDNETITEQFYEGMSLVAFDVGKEKFRTIAIPQDIIYSPEAEEDQLMQDRDMTLLEVSGHIALIDKDIDKLWLFMDDYDCSMEMTSGGGKWIRETMCIKLPLIDKKYIRFEDGVPGTDEILVKFKDVDWEDHFCICYYNWKNKTVSNIIQIATGENKYINHRYKLRIFTQSLLSV